MEHRLFNALSLVGGFFSIAGGILNLSVNPESPLRYLPLVTGSLFFVFYYVARFRRYFQGLLWPSILMIMGTLCSVWFLYGGLNGYIQYYYFPGVVTSIVLVRGSKNKTIVIIAFYLVTLAMLGMEYYWKSPFQNSNDAYRFLLTSTNYMLALTFLIVVIVMLSRNFRDILEKLQEYKIHFYEDLVLARILQERIFEYDHSLTKGYDLELVYLPYAELSGDLYDFSVPEDTYLRIFLADARGHGINSSLSSMLIKSEWMNLNRIIMSPRETLFRLNKRVAQRYGDSISFSAIVVDILDNKILFSSAGHIPQYVTHNRTLHELEAMGPAIGILEDADYQDKEIPFPPGAKLFLYTDALIEEFDQQQKQVGQEWLIRELRKNYNRSADICNNVLENLARLKGQPDVGSLRCQDDLTMIAVGHEHPAPSVFESTELGGFKPV